MATPAAVPRSIRRGPPITLTCECGERRELRYGERWQCEQCGRTWDTNRIPLEEYADVRRTHCGYGGRWWASACSRWWPSAPSSRSARRVAARIVRRQADCLVWVAPDG